MHVYRVLRKKSGEKPTRGTLVQEQVSCYRGAGVGVEAPSLHVAEGVPAEEAWCHVVR